MHQTSANVTAHHHTSVQLSITNLWWQNHDQNVPVSYSGVQNGLMKFGSATVQFFANPNFQFVLRSVLLIKPQFRFGIGMDLLSFCSFCEELHYWVLGNNSQLTSGNDLHIIIIKFVWNFIHLLPTLNAYVWPSLVDCSSRRFCFKTVTWLQMLRKTDWTKLKILDSSV